MIILQIDQKMDIESMRDQKLRVQEEYEALLKVSKGMEKKIIEMEAREIAALSKVEDARVQVGLFL